MRLRTALAVLSAVILAVPAFAAERKPLASAAELNDALWTNAAEAVRRLFAPRLDLGIGHLDDRFRRRVRRAEQPDHAQSRRDQRFDLLNLDVLLIASWSFTKTS